MDVLASFVPGLFFVLYYIIQMINSWDYGEAYHFKGPHDGIRNSQKEGLQRRFVGESGCGKCQGIC